jgi:hypothetical protein
MKTLKIEEKNARKLYPSASDEFKAMLEDTFGKEFFNEKITDRIKSYEDACEHLGLDPEDLPDVDYCQDEDRKSIVAYHKLVVITRALNEGWRPNWKNRDEYKYYGYLYVDSAGFVDADTHYTASDASIGSRLCFKSRELALYAINQFKSIYEEYIF